MAQLVLSSLILYGVLSVIIGSILHAGIKVLRIRKPKQISAEIKK